MKKMNNDEKTGINPNIKNGKCNETKKLRDQKERNPKVSP